MSEAFDPYRKWLGIPPYQQPPNHYRLLGIELFEADADAIANAADRQMAHIRTFQAGPHSALSQKLLNELSAARVCLLNPVQREAYDAALRARLAETQAAAAPSPTATPSPAAPPSSPTDYAPIPLAPAAPRAIPVPIAAPVPRPTEAEPSLDFVSAHPIEHSPAERRPAWLAPAVAAIALAGLGAAAYLGAHFFGGAGEQEQQVAAISPATPNEPPAQQPPAASESPAQSALESDAAAANRASEASTPREPNPPAPAAPAMPKAQPTDRGADAPDARSSPPPNDNSPSPTAPPGLKPNGNVFRVPPPEPVALLAGQIDVLKQIDLARDVVAGEWRLDGEELVSPAGGLARLRIAVPPGDEYVLVVDVERQSGEGGFGVGLSAGDAHAVMWFDGQGAEDTGLDGFPNQRNRIGRRPQLQGTIRLAYGVRKTGAVLLQPGSGNGLSWSGLAQWQGDFAAWKWPAGWTPPEKGRLELISSESSFRIRRLVLARAEGWEVDDSNVVRAAKGVPAFVRSKRRPRLFGRALEPEQKLPLPNAAELTSARQQIVGQNQPRLTSAKTPEARLNLARDVLGEARNTQRPAAERHALFDYARGLAAELGAAAAACEAVDQMDRWFEIDALALKLESLEVAAAAPPTPQGKLEQITAGLELMEACAKADRIADGNRAYGLAQAAARALKDAALGKQVSERKREFDKIAKARSAVKDDLTRLKTAPDDPEANLAVGKYFCLNLQNWEQGLKHLSAGSDAALAELARRDLSSPEVPEEQFRLAEAWAKFAADESGAGKASLDDRAKHWYRKAAPFLSGEAKQTAEKRLAPTGAVVDEAKTRYLTDLIETESKAARNFFFKGRSLGDEPIKVKDVASPHGLFMHPGKKNFAGVTYDLDRKSRRFKAEVGIDDTARGGPATPLVFEVWGDGKLMWQSKPVISKGQLQACDLNISRVKLLHLRVNCPGDGDNAHCVWIEPRVTLK